MLAAALVIAGPAPASAAEQADDETAPTIVDSGIAPGLIGVRPTITATVSDDVGVVRVELTSGRVRLATMAGTDLTTVTLRADLSSLRPPDAELILSAYDAAGNVGSSTTWVLLDQDLPTATLVPAAGAALGGTAKLQLTGVSGDTVSATLNELNTRRELGVFDPSGWTLLWNTAGQADFPTVTLTDQAGNRQTLLTKYRVDNEAPQIGAVLDWQTQVGSEVVSAPRGRVGGRGSFLPTVTDETRLRYTWLVDGKVVSTDGHWNTGTTSRNATVELRVTDATGHMASRKFAVVVDNTKPSAAITAPGTLLRGSRLTSTVKATDPSGIWKTRLSGASADFAAPYTSSIAAGKDGKKTLTWTVTDRLGNATVVKRTVTVDNTKATVAFAKAPKNKAKVKGTVKVAASASDKNGVARVELLVNGKVVAVDKKAAYKFSLNTKKYGKKIKVQLRAYDKAGNLTTSSTRTWYRR
ncbi:hypothetical protein ACTI_24370 [Actinoplanes sp. OR16]|nr:hypothetical protein ACTI_24370 [Actinoplanes sp. OR16]